MYIGSSFRCFSTSGSRATGTKNAGLLSKIVVVFTMSGAGAGVEVLAGVGSATTAGATDWAEDGDDVG